jgi:quercetin dioxygenase-like cupin family protein
MVKNEYSGLIRSFPEADIHWPGLRGWMLRSENGLAVFMECGQVTKVGEHSHGAQWGVVVAGELELTLSGVKRTYRKGDTYAIGKGEVHSATLSAGFKAIDVFADTDRYKPKA